MHIFRPYYTDRIHAMNQKYLIKLIFNGRLKNLTKCRSPNQYASFDTFKDKIDQLFTHNERLIFVENCDFSLF